MYSDDYVPGNYGAGMGVNHLLDDFRTFQTETDRTRKILYLLIVLCSVIVIIFSFLIMLNAYGVVGQQNDAAFDKGMSTVCIAAMVASIVLQVIVENKKSKME